MALDKPTFETGRAKDTENTERRSVNFFVAMRDKMIAEIGVPDQRAMFADAYDLSNGLMALNTIGAVQKERTGFARGTIDPIKDRFRVTIPIDQLQLDRSPSLAMGDEESLRNIKNVDLERLKSATCEYLKKFGQLKHRLGMLREVELHPEIKELLSKYNKSNVHELFEPGLEIKYSEIRDLSAKIASVFEYRNRKIKEFVAYRYARSVPAETDSETFSLNVHRIVETRQDNAYRDGFIKNSDAFSAPIPPELVPYAMGKLRETIGSVRSSGGKIDEKKEALKSYILFEMIHPFDDGNGRTGRALFVYLQRHLSKERSMIDVPIHIPIARYESGTIYPRDTGGSKETLTRPGSVSLDVNTLLKRILQREDIIGLGKQLPGYFSDETMDQEQLRKKFDDLFEGVVKILESEGGDHHLNELLHVIEKQSSLDDMTSSDWNMVYDSARKNLGTELIP